jgi:hypothetical protein
MKTKKETVGKGLHGKTSGLSKTAFYIKTFKENAKLKRNDAELQKLFDAEFPGTVSYKVNAMRAKLNRGGWGDQGFQSQPYGEPVKAKAAKKGPSGSISIPEAAPAKKEVPTIGIPDAAPEPAPPAKKVRLRRGKEA